MIYMLFLLNGEIYEDSDSKNDEMDIECVEMI